VENIGAINTAGQSVKYGSDCLVNLYFSPLTVLCIGKQDKSVLHVYLVPLKTKDFIASYPRMQGS